MLECGSLMRFQRRREDYMRYPAIESLPTPLAAGVTTILAATAIAVAVGTATAAADDAAAAPALTALQCGHLIDTANGKMLGATTIVIEGGRIKEVSSGVQAPSGAKVIDLSTQTCMPGLIDS